MEYVTTQEIAEQWGVSVRTVFRYLKDRKIPGAILKGKMWFIPKDAIRPLNQFNKFDNNKFDNNKFDNNKFDNNKFDNNKFDNKSKFQNFQNNKDNNFKCPRFIFSKFYGHREKMTSIEQHIYDCQNLYLQGKNAEAYHLLQELMPIYNGLPTYLQMGILIDMAISGAESGYILEALTYIKKIDKILKEDFLYKKEMELIYPIFKSYFSLYSGLLNFDIDSNYIYHEDAVPILTLRYIYKYTNNLSIGQINIGPEVTYFNAIANIYEANGQYPLAILINIALNYLNYFQKKTNIIGPNIKKAIALCIQHNYMSLLFEPLQTIGRPFIRTVNAMDSEFGARLQHLYNKHITVVINIMKTKGDNDYLSILTSEDMPFIYLVATGYTNGQIAEMQGISLSSVAKRLTTIYEELGIKKRADVKDYMLKLTKNIYF